MTKQSVVGAVLIGFGIGMGAAFIHKSVTFTVWVAATTLGPVALGAYLFDPAALQPLVDKVLARWRSNGPG